MPEVRRLAMLSLAGAGLAIDARRRVDLLQAALADRSAMVRLEALKAGSGAASGPAGAGWS